MFDLRGKLYVRPLNLFAALCMPMSDHESVVNMDFGSQVHFNGQATSQYGTQES